MILANKHLLNFKFLQQSRQEYTPEDKLIWEMCCTERKGVHETQACDLEVVIEEAKSDVGRRLAKDGWAEIFTKKEAGVDTPVVRPKYNYFNKCKEAAFILNSHLATPVAKRKNQLQSLSIDAGKAKTAVKMERKNASVDRSR